MRIVSSRGTAEVRGPVAGYSQHRSSGEIQHLRIFVHHDITSRCSTQMRMAVYGGRHRETAMEAEKLTTPTRELARSSVSNAAVMEIGLKFYPAGDTGGVSQQHRL